MSYAIIGFGKIGRALAIAFARKGIDVVVASRRGPDVLRDDAAAIGSRVTAVPLAEALKAKTVLLAFPFGEHGQVAKAKPSWDGQILIDVTNAFGVPPSDLGGLPSTVVVARSFVGAATVKAFNHLPAAILGAEPGRDGARRVVFVSSDDEAAMKSVGDLATALGYAPVLLGTLSEGGKLVQARGDSWAPLIFQDLFKFDD